MLLWMLMIPDLMAQSHAPLIRAIGEAKSKPEGIRIYRKASRSMRPSCEMIYLTVHSAVGQATRCGSTTQVCLDRANLVFIISAGEFWRVGRSQRTAIGVNR
jgi:hypothetical protein